MNWAEQWAHALVQSVTQFGVTVGTFIPKFLGMTLLLVIGYVVSKGVARLTTTILRRAGFDRVAGHIGLSGMLQQGNIRSTAAQMVGKLVFWFFMLTFVVSAADSLGLGNMSQTVESFVTYLPNVVGAVAIAVAGLLLAGFVRDAVKRGTAGVGLDYADALAKLVHIVLIIFVATLAIGQLKLEVALVKRVIEIFLIAGGAGLALTLGLGTRDLSKHIVAGVYARDTYTPGMKLTVGSDSGSVEEVGTISTRIRTPSGEAVYVPNGQFLETVVRGSEPSS
jgi:small-conductance mechanosensitive channel